MGKGDQLAEVIKLRPGDFRELSRIIENYMKEARRQTALIDCC